MINTKHILIEGVPCSGKSTIAERLSFRKIKVEDPQADWEHAIDSIRDFLEINRK